MCRVQKLRSRNCYGLYVVCYDAHVSRFISLCLAAKRIQKYRVYRILRVSSLVISRSSDYSRYEHRMHCGSVRKRYAGRARWFYTLWEFQNRRLMVRIRAIMKIANRENGTNCNAFVSRLIAFWCDSSFSPSNMITVWRKAPGAEHNLTCSHIFKHEQSFTYAETLQPAEKSRPQTIHNGVEEHHRYNHTYVHN